MELAAFNLMDLLLAAAIGFFVLRGLARGLVRELFSLAAVVTGWIVASRYHLALTEYLPWFAKDDLIGRAVLFALVFLAAAFAVRLAGAGFHRLLSDTPLGWANRLLGAFCGLLIGTLVIGVLLLVLTVYLPGGRGAFQNSVLYPHLTGVVRLLAKALPEEGKKLFDRHLKQRNGDSPANLEEYI